MRCRGRRLKVGLEVGQVRTRTQAGQKQGTDKAGAGVLEAGTEFYRRDTGSVVARTSPCSKWEGLIALPSEPCGY